MPEVKKYPNRLGIKGWLAGGKWGPERYLYFLHRVTGLGLLFYFLIPKLILTYQHTYA